jgi:hypothetical protein
MRKSVVLALSLIKLRTRASLNQETLSFIGFEEPPVLGSIPIPRSTLGLSQRTWANSRKPKPINFWRVLGFGVDRNPVSCPRSFGLSENEVNNEMLHATH